MLVLPPVIALWVYLRRRGKSQDRFEPKFAPHLVQALTVGANETRWVYPIDGVALLLILLSFGASGPTWSRVPNPLVAQTAPLVIALEVSEAMLATDVAPDRLTRAQQKILDLVALRSGARTALVAYAGSAHRVVPMTEDPNVLKPYLEGLTPEVMPGDGNQATAALDVARGILAKESTPGGILFVLQDLNPADLAGFAPTTGGADTGFLLIAPDTQNLGTLGQIDTLVTQHVTPDQSDIRAIDRALNAAYRAALLADERQQWDDRGWLFAWPAALLLLLWFRQGWTMRWSAILLALGLAYPSGPARADGIVDWFFTPDQQGQIAYKNKNFTESAELFADPMWRGYMQYRDGQYGAATETLGRLDTADASFAQGMAHIKNREYRPAIDAFEETLKRDADYPGAAHNLEVATVILDYVETTREQSDTGEHSGIGADDVVFDNAAERGAETDMDAQPDEGSALLTADQWMNTVDTRTGDFLRQRFALEAASGGN